MIRIFKEEFYDGTKFQGEYVEIFHSPSMKEIQISASSNLYSSSIRFIATLDKGLYLWSGEMIHAEGIQAIFGSSKNFDKVLDNGGVLMGVANLKNTIIEIETLELAGLDYIHNFDENYSIDKYIDMWEWMNKYKFIDLEKSIRKNVEDKVRMKRNIERRKKENIQYAKIKN